MQTLVNDKENIQMFVTLTPTARFKIRVAEIKLILPIFVRLSYGGVDVIGILQSSFQMTRPPPPPPPPPQIIFCLFQTSISVCM